MTYISEPSGPSISSPEKVKALLESERLASTASSTHSALPPHTATTPARRSAGDVRGVPQIEQFLPMVFSKLEEEGSEMCIAVWGAPFIIDAVRSAT